ncbi:MAG: cbb3-type cytochrome c oxidase subunit II [Actinomycetota bacterium]|nr:cbb3-type cytochrome c oxidase subunit II [Actinomycetota bacterium]
MSDVAAAAAALGIPESLVERSAAARAAETGGSTDEIIAAWAGGGAAPTTAAAPAESPAATSAPTAAPVPEPAAPAAAAIETPSAPAAVVAAPVGPYKPPKLIGARDNPAAIVTGAIALFLIVLLVGLVGPAISFESSGARTSEIELSGAAENGQALYTSLGCAACHTQMVRPVVADVGLGAVSLNDSNQVLGTRRFGPDLSNVGNRLEAGEIEAVIAGDSVEHSPHNLSDGDMSALVAYMTESRTTEG